MEPTLDISLEQQILAQLQGLREGQQGTQGQIRDIRTTLMGSGEPSGETQYGRIPMVETAVKGLEGRVDILEDNQLKASAYWNSARWIAGVIGTVCGTIGAGLIALIEHLVR